MHQVSFGDVLKEARIARGLDIAKVSRSLRIRQDIIVAIENGDFERMPSRGYTRNMIIAYARLVGLNPQDVSRMYLDQEYAYQISQAHRSANDMAEMHQVGRSRRDQPGSGRTGSFERVHTGRADAVSRNAYDGSSNGMGRRMYSQHDARGRSGNPQMAHTARHQAMTNGRYTNLYTQPRNVANPNAGRNRLIIIIAVAVLIVALVIGLFLTHRSEPTTTIPVTGAASSASTDSTSSEETAEQTTETAPTEFTFSYEVADGSETYIEVYVDDDTQEAHDVSGPASQSYTCTGKLRFVCTETDGVTATLDGEEVELTVGSSGIVNETFTLDDIVQEWNEEHGVSSSSSSSSKTSSSSSSSSSTSSTSNSSSSSSSSD